MLVAALLLGCALAQDPSGAGDAALELLSHAELTARMRALADGSDVAEVLPLFPGQKSRGGRDLLAVRLAAPEAPDNRPAILLVANVDGPEVFSSAVALHHAEEIARRWAAGDEAARALLEGATLYVVPRANPDAAEARFETPLAEVRASGHGVDNDRDGRGGEDGTADVDGDGIVTWMRVPDPEGTWIEDPTDPRANVEADRSKGQVGRWKIVREGFDSDGDEQATEDPVRDAVVNRNFAHDWEEHEPGAGLFPTDEPESRALCEFLLVHDDVALVVTYGELANLAEEPKSVKSEGRQRIPPSGLLEDDAGLMGELGRRYRDVVDRAPAPKGRGKVEGSFQTWVYHQRGLFSLDAVLWDIPLDAKAEEDAEEGAEEEAGGDSGEEPADGEGGEEEKEKEKEKKDDPSDDAKRLIWIDANGEASRFVDWKPFEHPQLGPVEIGGFAPFARTEPPGEEGAEIAADELVFLLSLGALLPRVRLVDCTARELGAGLLEVEAALQLDSLLPLRSAAAGRARTVRPARLELLVPDGAEVVAGRAIELVGDLAGSGDRRSFRWLVRGAQPHNVGVRVRTDHAGSDHCVPEVK